MQNNKETMNYDLLNTTKQDVLEYAKNYNITALTPKKDFTLIDKQAQLKNVHTPLAIATNANKQLLAADIDAVIYQETSNKEDFAHHRRGGLDQVSFNLLKEKNAAIILDIHTLKTADNPHQLLGRMIQNATIAHKKGVSVLLVSMADCQEEIITTHDQEAFWRAVGIPQAIVEKNQEAIKKLFAQAKLKTSKTYIADGITYKE